MTQTILITGASSGIGEALAKEYSSRFYNKHKDNHSKKLCIIVTARRLDLLEKLKGELESKYAGSIEIIPVSLDVTNYRQVHNFFSSCKYDISLVISSAGITEPLSTPVGLPNYHKLVENAKEDNGMRQFLENKKVIDTNLLGSMAIVSAALNHFRKRKIKSAQIVGISSIAGDRGFPGIASYSSSKIGITRFLDSVRAETKKEGITITTILPGYIDTPMNNMIKSRPFVIPVEQGAKEMYELITKKVNGNVSVPWWPWLWLRNIVKILPQSVLGSAKYEFSKL